MKGLGVWYGSHGVPQGGQALGFKGNEVREAIGAPIVREGF